MKLQGVVVDMDGTITRFNLDYMAARRRVLDELEHRGLRAPDIVEEASLYVVLDKLRERMPPDEFRRLRLTFYKYFEEMELRAARDVTLLPGVEKTLAELRAQSLKLGLVTNNSKAGTTLTLKRLNLQSAFDAIVTRDDCDQMKPASAPVLKTLKELNIPPEAAILVGDGVVDVLAAKAAGIRSAAVTPGPFPLLRILNAQPDYLLGSINDLPALIEQLNT